jgi:HSP20 family protein
MAMLPPIEMFDKKDKLVVRAEIPGVKPEEIDISVSDSTLTIKGERKSESEIKDEDYYRCEMSYGRFSRSVALPAKVQPDKVDAKYDDGILEINLSKMSETKRRKVAVKAKQAKAK